MHALAPIRQTGASWRGGALSCAPMPAPPKTTDAEIIEAARKLVERDGHGGFSMNDVAAAVGVRAPSLYGRFADRAALLTAVEVEVWRKLARAIGRVPQRQDPVETLAALARAYRAFGKAHPKSYALIFNVDAERSEEGAQARAAAVAITLPSFAALVGEDEALAAARTLVPFLHGFVSMELASAFRLGGGIDDAFERGVATILAGLSTRHGRRPPRRP